MNTKKNLRNSQPSAEQLWLMLQAGQKSGLEGLYFLFSHDLFKFGLSMVPDQDFVQDCIQELFIDLWKYHRTLQKAQNIKVYLFKSLSRKISRANQKEKLWKLKFRNGFSDSHVVIESIESVLIEEQKNHELQKKIARAVAALPVRQKEVILYLFFEEFSYEEISGIMGINLRSVYTLAWKAISSLKKSLFFVLALLVSLLG